MQERPRRSNLTGINRSSFNLANSAPPLSVTWCSFFQHSRERCFSRFLRIFAAFAQSWKALNVLGGFLVPPWTWDPSLFWHIHNDTKLPVSVKKHSSGEEDTWAYCLQKHQIRGWRAISAVGLQGKVWRKRNVYFTDTGMSWPRSCSGEAEDKSEERGTGQRST